MNIKPKSVDEYIQFFEPEIQERLKLIHDTILKAAPGAEESIRYNMPAFKLNKHYIYFSAYKKHIVMYPMYGLAELEQELSLYRAKDTKDSIHFLHTKKIPVKLIAKIVKAKLKKEAE